MKRYMPTFVQRAGETEQWYGMKEDDDGDWYERKEADAHIAELERALKSCSFVISKHLKQVDDLTPLAIQAMQEADRALSV